MPILKESDRSDIRKVLEQLEQPVTIVNFTQQFECESCAATRQLMEELVELSAHLKLEVYDFVSDREKAEELAIERVPAVAVVGDRDYGIRFYGPPAGYEFASLLEAVVMASKRESGLSEATKEKLREVTMPLHLEVLVTPT